MKNRPKLNFLILNLLLFLTYGPVSAGTLPVISHKLHVSIDVAGHRVSVSDTVNIGALNKNNAKLYFALNKSLEITGIYSNPGKKLDFYRETDEQGKQIISLKDNLPSELISLTIEYAGAIYNPVEKSKTLGFVRGDHTAGVISEQGVYLSPETVWYPAFENFLSRFEISAEIDSNYKVVTQGDLLSRETKNGKSMSHWKSDVPVDGLVLIAGKYFVYTQKIDGVEIGTYFFNDNKELAEKYIQKCAEYIKIYSGLLGPYPYKRFDAVENFFSSGYGFPYFTLLGSGVIHRGEEAFRPGYLDHELVHSWWGNYVYNDFRKGNWVEALTTYCANYFHKELREGGASASKHRKRASVAYSLNVKPGIDYPFENFQGKTRDFDGDIGYGKGSMVFHQLRLTVGDEVFWESLGELAKGFGGRYAEWPDIKSLFEEKSGKDLDEFFNQWLKRKGGPSLRLDDIKVTPVEKGYKVTGSVLQASGLYKCDVPLHIDLGRGRNLIFDVSLTEKVNHFEFVLRELPVYVKLDPEFHLFRVLAPEEIQPRMKATLAAKNKIFFIAEKDQELHKTYTALAEKAIKGKGGRLAAPGETLEQLLEKYSVFILGNSPQVEKLLSGNAPGFIKFQSNEIEIKEKKYKGPEYSLLLSLKNPHDLKKTITLYYGLGAKALERARYIFYYGHDGYLVFKNGRPVDRGDIDIPTPNSVFNVPEALSAGINEEGLMNYVKKLASDEMEGRLAGSPGAEKALRYIESHLKNIGLAPERQAFSIHLQGKTINKLRLDITEPEKETTNLYALLKGNAPEYSNEAIIIGAHYDHLGKDIDGKIFHGADDNATGVATLLELAKQLVKNKDMLKRSVLFVFFSGEEWGCGGAEYFADNPPYPGLKKIAMLNVDTIGRGVPGYYYFVGTSYYPSLFNISKKFSSSIGLKEGKNIDKFAYTNGSDHYPFHLKGIAAVDYYSSNYREMNSLKDTISEIDSRKLSQVARLVYITSFQLLTDYAGLAPVRFAEEKCLANIKQLTFGGENAEAYFSTDGKDLIFQSTRDGRKCDQIYTMTVEGQDVKMVSTGKGATTCSYYLADKSGIVYSSTHSGAPECPPKPDYTHGYVWPLYKDYDIFRAEPDGSNIQRLTDTPGYDAEPTVSPDGKKIVFTSMRDGDLELYTMDIDGGNVKRLTDEVGYDGGAFFSADSKKIIYRAGRLKDPEKIKDYKDLLSKELIRPGRLEIFIMDADGANKKQITNNGAANFCPFMSPDGKRVIFSSNLGDPKGRNFDLYIINIDGTGLERVTHNPSFDAFPMFSPDGKKLVFGSNRGNRERGETNVFIADWVE